MGRDSKKKESSCIQLNRFQSENLAMAIIAQTRREFSYGTDRRKRMAAPGGAVILF